MKTDNPARLHVRFATALSLVLLCVRLAGAQTTSAPPAKSPDDTPSVKVGATIFADFTYVNKPTAIDTDGNVINPSSFNVTRSYINITGNVSHLVAFRVTPDVTRETGNSSLNGGLTFRVKYAFMQINLDDWLPKGSWIRFGIHPTPFIEFEDTVYRYRFQGQDFFEREGYQSSSDAGISFHTALPAAYGDVHVGFYNGEGYTKAETNDQKALMVRGTVRPLPRHSVLRGLLVTGYYTADNYVKNAERTRVIVNVMFEHRWATVGFDRLRTYDRTLAASTDVHGTGWSVFFTPKLGATGFELLLRHDSLTPDKSQATQVRRRNIFGLAYWFPHKGAVSAALMVDADTRSFTNINVPTDQRIFLHSLIAF